MALENLALPAVLLITLAALILAVSSQWRISLIALGLQYLGVTILVAQRWPFELAAIKLVAGWMAAAVLAMAMMGLNTTGLSSPRKLLAELRLSPMLHQLAEILFRLLTALLVILTMLSFAGALVSWIPGLQIDQAWAALILIGIGLLQLGFAVQPLANVLGLLTVLAGFEIIYATVENSALVAGLLAVVTLGLALIGAYLITAPGLEGESE
jgi:hypothetical protein